MNYQGFVHLSARELYAEYQPSLNNAPVILFLNGLSSSCQEWQFLRQVFLNQGFGTLCFDFRGQGKSLRRELELSGPIQNPVSVESQTDDLHKLIQHFQISSPLHMIGNSYGGGVALDFANRNPGLVGRMILLVPYLIRLDRSFPLQRIWSQGLQSIERLGFIQGFSLEHSRRWYRRNLAAYMDHRFSHQVPDPIERKAAIDLALGILDLNGLELLPTLDVGEIHLVSVGRDTLVPRSLFQEMWAKTPARLKKSWLYIEDGEHLLLQQFPQFISDWISKIYDDQAQLMCGNKFRGCGETGEVTNDLGQGLSFD